METSGLRKSEVIQQLIRSPHGKLEAYFPPILHAAAQDPEFLAHLIAWNFQKGQIRDSKVAIPVVSIPPLPPELRENSWAHIAALDPRNFLRAIDLTRQFQKISQKEVRRLVEKYLRAREQYPPMWVGAALQHRATMKTLYARYHIKPATFAKQVLFDRKYPKGSVFHDVQNLKNMSETEAAGAILKHKIPFLVIQGALGEKLASETLLMALIKQMSSTELVTNMRLLERLGVKNSPSARAALEEGMSKLGSSKANVLKTTKAAEAVKDTELKKRVEATQEKQIKRSLEGDWLVLGDNSQSMTHAIKAAQEIAAYIARAVQGDVHLIFENTEARYFSATGKSLRQINDECGFVSAYGMTSLGVGLQYALERNKAFDAIAIVTDGGENAHPRFVDVYKQIAKKIDYEPPIYVYLVRGQAGDTLTPSLQREGVSFELFDLRNTQVDYYGLPTLVDTMNVKRFTLVDQIMETPLLTLERALQLKGDD